MPVLDQFFANVFAKYGVCNYTLLRSELRNYINNKGEQFASLEEISSDKFKKKLTEITNEFHSAYYLRVHPVEEWNKVNFLFSFWPKF